MGDSFQMKKYLLLLGLLVVFNLNCNTTNPPDNKSLSLSLEDVSCTEAWFKLEIKNTSLPVQVSLYTDDILKNTFNVSANDSIIYVDSLQPNKTYNIHSAILPINQSEIKSNELSITTMDTTSNNFTWQTFTFGDGSESSFLYDLSIVDENNIWCVGEIYLRDS